MHPNRIIAGKQPLKGNDISNVKTGLTDTKQKWPVPIITPTQRLELIKKRPNTDVQKRKILEIPPPDMDPTIRKKIRVEHSSVQVIKNRLITKEASPPIPPSKEKFDTFITTSAKETVPVKDQTLSTISSSSDSDAKTDNSPENESLTTLLSKELEISIDEGELIEISDEPTSRPRTSTPKPEISPLEEPQSSTSTDQITDPLTPATEVKPKNKPNELYEPEPFQDYPSYDPQHSNCQKYVPTSEFIFDLYCIIRKANQNLGIALREAMIKEKLLITKNSK